MFKLKTKEFKQKFANVFLHSHSLGILNFLILILLYSCLKLTWIHLNPEKHFEEAVEVYEGFGTILMGFGVVLEERVSLKQIVGVNTHDKTDEVCHDYGVIFVVLGVITEVFAWLVKIPNDVLDTYEVEFVLIQMAALTALIGGWFQIKFQYESFKASRKNPVP